MPCKEEEDESQPTEGRHRRTITTFQQLEDELKRNILRILKDSGASHRQLEGLEQREQCDARIDIAES